MLGLPTDLLLPLLVLNPRSLFLLGQCFCFHSSTNELSIHALAWPWPQPCFPKTIPASYPAGSSRSKSAAPWNAPGVLALFISLLSSTSWPLFGPLPLLHLCLDRSHAPPPSRAQLPQFLVCLMSVTVFYPTSSRSFCPRGSSLSRMKTSPS